MIFIFHSCIFILFFELVTSSDVKRYDEWSLIVCQPKTRNQWTYLNSLNNEINSEVQIWQHGSLKRPFHILSSPTAKTSFLANLQKLGIDWEVRIENIQQAIDSENENEIRNGTYSTRTRSIRRRSTSWFNRFLKWEQVNALLQQLARDNPKIVRLQAIGRSHEGRPILLAQVSTGGGAGKPAIWIDGGIHAREWIAVSSALYMLTKLVNGYNSNRKLRNYVTGATWYIAPVLNPDGYAYTQTDRMWRKNRRPKACSGNSCCSGVDLNRNFGFDFGGAGTSASSCQDIYRGPKAFSEPESRAVRDFLLRHKEVKAYISLHSYSQMWFYPFGNRRRSYASNWKELETLAKQGAHALSSVRGTKYAVGTAADILYPASGGSDDWAKAGAGIRYVYTLELIPNGNSAGNGFIVPAREIIPTGEETWAGLSVIANAVIGSARG